MGAREKLNMSYLQGAVVLAAVVGVLTSSWAAFGIALAVLVAGALHDGAIRLHGRGR
jgi:hypothetical protein